MRTTAGQRPIADLEPGDEVLASDEASGTTATYPISAVWSHPDALTGTVTIDGEAIATTPEHPFRTVERGWVAAAELEPGDHVTSLTGSAGLVGSITWDRGPDTMWNLTVETAHTYTVGTGGWLVHNDCHGVTDFASKGDAKAAFSGPDQGAQLKFVKHADSKARDFRATTSGDGATRLEYFSPARNRGYGKHYSADFDASGALVSRTRRSVTEGPDQPNSFWMITKEERY